MTTEGHRGAEAGGRARAVASSGDGAAVARAVAPTPMQNHGFDFSGGLRFVDLFSGVGGFSLGCMQAGIAPIAAFDNDPEAVLRYEANLGSHVHALDLADATAADVLALTNGVVPDMVVGGPPCQGFSSIGKRDPNDPRSALAGSFARIVAALQPKAFAMENVPGILSMGTIAADLRTLLREAGYADADWVLLNAADFGVPQKRVRAVLMGSRSGAKPTAEAVAPQDAATVTVRQALRGLPPARSRGAVHKNAFVRYPAQAEPGSYDERMRNPSGFVTGCQRTVHEKDVRVRLKALRGGEEDTATDYRRLEAGGLAPALRAGSRRRTACRPIHPFADRVITVREAARLHGFPDWFEFSDVVSLAHVQIGNSVPPPMGEGIARWLASAAAQEAAPPAAAAASA